MKNIVPDYRLDMVGEPCPYPAVATLEAMPQLFNSEVIPHSRCGPQREHRCL